MELLFMLITNVINKSQHKHANKAGRKRKALLIIMSCHFTE